MVEFHFHDSEFTLFGRSVESEDGDESATGTGLPEESDGSSAVGALVALVVLVLVAFAVRRALSGGGSDDSARIPKPDVESGV